MKALKNLTLFLLISLYLAACGGSTESIQKTEVGNIPEWYSHFKNDPNFFMATATETSRDLQLAVDKAEATARAKLARQVKVRVTSLVKKFKNELSNDEATKYMSDFTTATKTFTDQTLVGTRPSKQKIVRDGNNYRAYVMMLYPIGAASEALVKSLSKNKELEVRFRESQAFKELDQEQQKASEIENQIR